MKIEKVKIKDLKEYALNAKRHPDSQIEGIMQSIKTFKFIQPVVIDANNEIIIGHGRTKAAHKLGMDELPCVRVEGLTEAQIRTLRLVDNRIAETGWDNQILIEELQGLDADLSGFNVDFEFLKSEFGDENKEEHWEGMPEYESKEPCFKKIIVNFDNQEDVEKFFKILNQEFTEKTKSIWFPEKERRDLKNLVYE